MINPGTSPLTGTREDVAADNVHTFLAAVQQRVPQTGGGPVTRTAELTGDPVRDPAADRDGRYGWTLHFTDGHQLRLLMPGTDITGVRDDITAAAPCLYLNGHAYWWNDAVARTAAQGLTYRDSP